MNKSVRAVALLATAGIAMVAVVACGGGEGDMAGTMRNQQAGQGITVGEPNGGVPVVSEYIRMAREASCATTRNRLYVIDSKYVLWDRAGDCADNAYGQQLLGASPQALLCSAAGTIAGARIGCSDASLRPLFDTVLNNLERADLGLGASHKVERVDFLPPDGTAVPFRTVASEDTSNIKAPREVVVKDAAAWAALWAEHGASRAAPPVDFSQHMLVAVFAGEGTAGCGGFDIVHAGVHAGQLLVEYALRHPSPMTACPAVVTQPMRVVALPRSDARLVFRKIVSDFANFTTVEPNLRTQVLAQRNVVVRDEAAWAALWAEHAGRDAALPKVDFTRQMVIGVFRGAQPDGCRSTAIRSVDFRDGKLHVVHVDTVPGPGILCTMAIVYPSHLVIVDRSEAPVEFIREVRTLQ